VLLVLGSLIFSSLVLAQGDLYVASDFTPEHGFTEGIEGPAVDRDGTLYVVNFQSEGTIGRVSEDGTAEVFVHLPQGSTGNGIRFQRDGSMLVADYTGHNLLRVDVKAKAISVWAHEGRMNQPNDLTIMKNGTVFASDPKWSDSTGQLWRFDRHGKATLVEKDMGTTNGVEVSPDQRYLYVNESVQRRIWRYRLGKHGELSDKSKFAEFTTDGLDGMRCDPKGNLYVARYGKGTILKLSPEGKVLKEIALKGKKPSNVTFGDKDGKTVFVTLQDRGSIEKFRVDW
jgi:gluconolactonase